MNRLKVFWKNPWTYIAVFGLLAMTTRISPFINCVGVVCVVTLIVKFGFFKPISPKMLLMKIAYRVTAAGWSLLFICIIFLFMIGAHEKGLHWFFLGF